MTNQGGKQSKPETNTRIAGTGNASNPMPDTETAANENQLIGKKGEKYLRESGNIEDMPDANEEQEAGIDQSND
jgi:hypothetical protein